MNLICLFLVNLLLFDGYLMANIDRESSHGEIQPQNNSVVGPKVDVLNKDFLFATFDDITLEEIMEFSRDSRISDFVKTQIFPVKYHNYMFYIIGNEVGMQGLDTMQSRDDIFIFDHNLFFEMLKYVGKSIQRIGISNEYLIDNEHSAYIQRQINEHCSDSLTYFSIGAIKENCMLQYTKPFSKVEYLNVVIAANQVVPTLTFSEIFPNLKRLNLGFYDFALDAQFLGGELSRIDHLEHLEIFVQCTNGSNRAVIFAQLGNFLQINDQIRSLTYALKSGDFIQVINDKLPNLENFTISNELDAEMQPTHLDNAKHFVVYEEIRIGPLERISFSRLESVSMKYPLLSREGSEKARNSWISFFKNHQNLRKLFCKFFNSDGLLELLAGLPNLDEVHLKSYEHFDMDFIRRLIADHKDLLRLQLDVSDSDNLNQPDLESYREQFGNMWNITLNSNHHVEEEFGRWSTLIFERKN